jgi:hypothetical protein
MQQNKIYKNGRIKIYFGIKDFVVAVVVGRIKIYLPFNPVKMLNC